jgi:hypothetical protein
MGATKYHQKRSHSKMFTPLEGRLLLGLTVLILTAVFLTFLRLR